MVMLDLPPPRSNQTPISPRNPLGTNSLQGIPQHITTWYPHTVPATDNYQGISQHITTVIPPGTGPDAYGFQGVPQHIRTRIPPGRGPDNYGKMSYGFDTNSFVVGGILGFLAGVVLFTATGRKFAAAAGARATQYISR